MALCGGRGCLTLWAGEISWALLYVCELLSLLSLRVCFLFQTRFAMVFHLLGLRPRSLLISPPVEVWLPVFVLIGAVGGSISSPLLSGGRV